jgi:serine protease Do
MTQPASSARLARRPLRDQVRALAALALLLVAACSAAPNGAVARAAPDSFSPLVKRVLPAVVNIAVTATVTGNDVAA